jgi:hypothetical protein
MEATQNPTAFCSAHGFFKATAFALAPGAKLTIRGVATNCPVCDGASEIIPGIYEAHADRINLLVDPSISHEALAALKKVAEDARANKITLDQAKQRAEQIAPGTGRLFDIANWGDQAKATLYASIIGAIAVIAAARMTSNPSQTVIIERPAIGQRYEPHPPRDILPGLPGGPPLRTKT